MSLNSSSYSDNCPHFSSGNSFVSGSCCLFTQQGFLLYTTFSVTKILLLLPLCILVLHLGLQRRRQQGSTSSAATTSHSDSFTYHMVAVELIGVLGQVISWCGIYEHHASIHFLGFLVSCLTWYGEMSFHILTCVERYLAVVHPITYLSLRGQRGIRIRNISIGCVWLLCFANTSVLTVYSTLILDFCILIFSLIVVFFCSLSVLRALVCPGPGEQGGDRERVDQLKKRAFYTIVAILGVLLLRCVGSLAWNVLYYMNINVKCVTFASELWVNLPSGLVLPLLFLHRAGTLACCKSDTK